MTAARDSQGCPACSGRTDSGADLVVISGPSGVGKSTVVRRLLQSEPGLRFSVSATTRPPRGDEQDGREYWFLSPEEFGRLLARDGFIEHAEVFGRQYGTPVEELARARGEGKCLLLEIDVQGGLQVRRRFPGALLVLLVAPLEEVRRRLAGRGTEGDEEVERRFREAESELALARTSGAYNVEVVNDEADRAVGEIARLIDEHRRANS